MLTITDATPDHPTMAQLGNNPSLDYMRSVGRGSATIDGVEIRPDGARRPVHFDYQQQFLREARAASTWGDAENTFDWFARDTPTDAAEPDRRTPVRNRRSPRASPLRICFSRRSIRPWCG